MSILINKALRSSVGLRHAPLSPSTRRKARSMALVYASERTRQPYGSQLDSAKTLGGGKL